jgi:hypothetical protein
MYDLMKAGERIFNSILRTPNFQLHYANHEYFRYVANDALHTFEISKNVIKNNYGQDALIEYEDALKENAKKVRDLISKSIM